ncbi:sugar ABC transporter substrate-binding protein [Metabacillus litoralis]|uniref:Sugar ABC transporter substrate-binding protein n=1 Tax=Metabacillus litoralis TaxID=152268 RepID=A0A179T9L9_9BACI|nr:sugar ABC transporter substrate-binding protein [Metabacillus litoralis]OAS89102.1 sugar ABC transporter substrate-binding protein [Metabacillus litoralis]
MKKTIVVMIVLLFSIGLAACSNEEKSSNQNNGKQVELTFATWGSPAEFEVLQKAVDKFNEEHEGIHVKDIIGIPWANYNQTITTRLQGGEAPDVFYVNGQNISNLIETKSILPINDFMESSESYVKVDEYPKDIWGPSDKDGIKYGFSVDSNPIVMYYNKKVFEEAGVKTPQEYFDEGKWNWDAMEEVTSQLVEAGKYGFVQDPAHNAMLNWVWANGGEFAVDGEVVVQNDPKAKEAFEFVNKMIESGNFVSGGTLPEGQGSDAMFMSNQVGMIGGGRWYSPGFKEANVEYDYIPWPSNTENKLEPAEIATAFLSVNSDTEHKEAALKFASYYSSEIGQEVRLKGQGNAVPSVLGLDHLITDSPETEHAKYLLDARNIGRVVDFAVSIPGLNDELNSIYQLFMLGDLTVDETINQLAETSQKMVAENKE